MSALWHRAKSQEELAVRVRVEGSSSQWETQQTKASLGNENVTQLENK